ncbi:helix-hairpin-helix domain-containing protein [Kitasatospora sp. NPDC048545]|uniref:DNA polymerase Y family protein n=1 Tax=Kitasatospora sp. NPDC048545 TaxID=3157208 RepID=UPI0033FF9750
MTTDRAILHLRLHHPPLALYTETFTVLADITPLVQALPPDSAALDITGALTYFHRTPEEIADTLATRLLLRYGLTCAIGGGPTRLHAQLAADTLLPGQIRILHPHHDDTDRFLRTRPTQALPGIGPKLARTLARYGITTTGDLADLPLPTLQRIAGTTTARLLHDRAHGTDPRRVAPTGPPASITVTRRYPADVLDPDTTRQGLLALATDLGTRLRTVDQTTRHLELTITYADRSTTTRSRTLHEPTHHTPTLRDTLYAIHTRLGLQRARIRALTARAGHLTPATHAYTQLTLDPTTEDQRRLEPVLDKANNRWGTGTLRPAALATPGPNDKAPAHGVPIR